MPETRIIAKLKGTSAVTDLIGTGNDARVRMHQRRTSWEGSDAITLQRISTQWSNHSTGTSTLRFCRIQLDLWSSTPLGVRSLATAVRGALSGWSDTSGTPDVTMCHLENEMDGPEGPDAGEEETEYRIVQDYLVQTST